MVLVGAWLSAGCLVEEAQAAFASDFNCPTATAEETMSAGRFKVHGCGRQATYVCHNVCVLQMVDQDSRSSASEQDERPRRKAAQKLASEVRVESKGDDSVMLLELVLDQRALLRVTATPDKLANVVQLKLIREETSEDLDECNLDFMINGQVQAMPRAVAARRGNVLSHRVQIGRELINELGTADKIAVRACKERWGLSREQVQKIREFMDRFQEEMAWKAPPRNGPSGGMLAPSGGWPAWSAPEKPLPVGSSGPVLDAPALFKKLSVSVFQLEAKRAEGTAQGSAVAVSPTELVTNCHVVQGALKLTLKQGKEQWPASVVRADPPSDRCTITAAGKSFQPVVGVRAYDSVEVGEAAYTLGSPVGLELTLSSGLVSGRREEQGHPYLQTTAPISPGSSGGGLFDARGNLLGITTLVLVGREHLNQSLNFAIPADTFARP